MTSKVIVQYDTEKKKVRISTPSPEYVARKLAEGMSETAIYQELANRVCSDPHVVMERSELPTSRYFRNCWKLDKGKVCVCEESAKSQKMAEIREKRNERLAALDGEELKNLSMGYDGKLTEVRQKKQALRDLPENVILDGLTLDELEKFSHPMLEG